MAATLDTRRKDGADLDRLGLIAVLQESGVLTPTALNLAPVFDGKDLESEEALELFAQFGRFFGRLHRSAKWWIADWLNFGEGVFGERVAQVVEETGFSYGYLSNIAWVGRNIPPSRRRDGVSFSLHAEVAPLPPKEQKRWLREAVEKDWATRDLRRAIQADSNGGVSGPEPDPSTAPLSATRILEAARQVAAQATRHGRTYVVPAEQFDQLLAAIGRGK